MKEYEKSQNIIAESLLEKDVLDNIRNKLKQRKKNKTKKNNNNNEEMTISDKIYEARKLKYFSNSENEDNIESLKKYVAELEDDLKEKEDFIKELLFGEYIHQENYQNYQNINTEKNKQINEYYSKILELNRDKKKNR